MMPSVRRADAGVLRLWRLKGYGLLTSDYAIEEAPQNLTTAERRERLAKMLETTERGPAVSLDPEARGNIELREKDWPDPGRSGGSGCQPPHHG